MPRNLIIAYIVTWAVHAGYLAHLWRKWSKIKDQ
jgi:hypothetical protein